jgi:hypothetical protein
MRVAIMKRLYYLTDSLQCAEGISTQMHQQGVSDWNFHIMSRNHSGVKKHSLHSSNWFFHDRDVIRSAERGALIGLYFSFIFLTGLIFFTEFQLTTSLAAPLINLRYFSLTLFVLICIAVSIMGAVIGGVIGMMFENTRVARFHDALGKGQYLLMIDVKKEQAEDIRQWMSQHMKMNEVGIDDSTVIKPFELVGGLS